MCALKSIAGSAEATELFVVEELRSSIDQAFKLEDVAAFSTSFLCSVQAPKCISPVLEYPDQTASKTPQPSTTKHHIPRKRQRLREKQATMQLPTIALLLALLTTLSLAAQSPESLCRAKSQRTGSLAAASIRALCAKTDLVANSPWAMQGAYAGPNQIGTHAFVAVKNHCPDGSNWIPQRYCLSQFYEICARGDKYGHGVGRYGRGGCQEFNLQAR